MYYIRNFPVFCQIMNQNYIKHNTKHKIINKVSKIKNNCNCLLKIEKIYLIQLNRMKAKLEILIVILNKIRKNNFNINYKRRKQSKS